MNIVKAKPPFLIAERCEAAFGLESYDPCFTYGDTIFNPSGNPIDASLMAHEATHQVQQGDEPEKWWDRYLTDKQFRFEQELQAYRVQYKTMQQMMKDRNRLAKLLVNIASDLSGSLYGNMCTLQEAIGLIRE